jgi:hypothetical protein
MAAALLMGAFILVAVFYCIETLQRERRDRSILFWKSLPVSDVTTVLTKASIPFVVLPLIACAIAFAVSPEPGSTGHSFHRAHESRCESGSRTGKARQRPEAQDR